MMKSNYDITEKSAKTVVIDDYLPYENRNRLGIYQKPKFIVIHEVSLGTGMSPANYNLEHYQNKIHDEGKEKSIVGYHYLCGDDKILHFIPDCEAAKHCGSSFNDYSIGIERLICEGISYPDALHNQAKLTATLMVRYNIGINRVITHQQARLLCEKESKPCPNRLIVGMYGGMKTFYEEVKLCLKNKDFFMEVLNPNYQLITLPDKQKKLVKD